MRLLLPRSNASVLVATWRLAVFCTDALLVAFSVPLPDSHQALAVRRKMLMEQQASRVQKVLWAAAQQRGGLGAAAQQSSVTPPV